MFKNGINFYLLVNGRAIDEYNHEGKIYVEGRKNSEYEIVFQNNSAFRKKIIFSVDGLNILTGDNNWQKGYVVDSWEKIVIPGWRIDTSKVAKFVFSSMNDSYNQHNASGDKNNIGVIGAMVFKEKISNKPHYHNYPHPHYHYHYYPNHHYSGTASGGYFSFSTTGGGGGRGSVMDSGDYGLASDGQFNQLLGTGWGNNQKFETKRVDYDFHDVADDILTIYYDNAKGLVRRGINLNRKYTPKLEPNAFPGYRDGCPLPIK